MSVPARIEIMPGTKSSSEATCDPHCGQNPRRICWPLPPGEAKKVSSPSIWIAWVEKNMMGTKPAPVECRQSLQKQLNCILGSAFEVH